MSRIFFKDCRYLITHAAPDGVVEQGGVLVNGPSIEMVGPSADLQRQIGSSADVEIVDCSQKIVLPGLIDCHNHVGEYHMYLVLGMSRWRIIRGIIEGLEHLVWPAWTWLTAESTYDLTLLGLVNLLKHGTTTSANAFHFPDAVYSAAEHAGVRMAIQPQLLTAYRMADGLDEQGYLAETERALTDFHGSLDGRITVDVHASWPWNCTQSILTKGMALAEKYDVQFTTHLFEGPDEKRMANELCADDGGALAYLKSLGLITERSVFYHCTQLDEAEIDMIAAAGAGIAHCPTNNARKGDCAYVPYMLDAGVRLGLATDNPSCNLFKDMMAMAMFHNIMPREKRSVAVHVPLELATMGSARVMRLEDRIGSLEAGKRADIISIDLRRNTDLMPLNAGMLLYFLSINGPGTHVDDAMVDGVFLRRNGEFTTLDEEAIIAKGHEWFSRFSEVYTNAYSEGKSLIDKVHEEFTKI